MQFISNLKTPSSFKGNRLTFTFKSNSFPLHTVVAYLTFDSVMGDRAAEALLSCHGIYINLDGSLARFFIMTFSDIFFVMFACSTVDLKPTHGGWTRLSIPYG